MKSNKPTATGGAIVALVAVATATHASGLAVPFENTVIATSATCQILEQVDSTSRSSEGIPVSSRLEAEFRGLVSSWERETGMLSMMHRKAMHPAYQRVIGMGKDALPLILAELKKGKVGWLWALCAITGEDAATPSHNIRQAVAAWLEWGVRNGYIETTIDG